jgi:hypothetical protein
MRTLPHLVALSIMASIGPAAAAATSCTPEPPPLRYATPHFSMAYADSGDDAVTPGDAGAPATLLDGTVIASVPGGDGIPDYVQLVGAYLEYARDVYLEAGFRVPDTTMAVSLFNDLGAYGMYLPVCDEIYLEPDLVSPGTTATHELFHAVQYRYWSQADFASIPSNEQAFYKEATADWAMIEVMRPLPYISWFSDPDHVGLFQAGTSAAFFWIYYLEQLSDWQPGDPLAPGFDAMRAYLERVATGELDLRGALEAGPEAAGFSLDTLLERFTLANLLENPLENVSRYDQTHVIKYVYRYAIERGFSNAVTPTLLAPELAQATNSGAQLEFSGTLSHTYAAAYFEIDPAMLGSSYQKLRLAVSGEGVEAWLVQLRLSPSGRRVSSLGISRATATTLATARLGKGTSQRVWVVVYAPSEGQVAYDAALTFSD